MRVVEIDGSNVGFGGAQPGASMKVHGRCEGRWTGLLRQPTQRLTNLMLACTRCNSDKAGALPAVEIIDRVPDRDRAVLRQIATDISWPPA